MDTTLKQRILGIIVLFALLGICLSVLLHHNKNAQRSRMPTITKTTTTPPPIVNTTSALLNSNNSANMTPANTNVFDSDISPPSNTATPNTAAATSAVSTPATPTNQAQPQLQQQLQTPAQPTTATPQTSAQSSAAFNETSPQSPSQPVVNNQASPSTVATSAIKPIAPPSNTPSQDVSAQINAANANAASTSAPNTDDAYASLPNDTNSTSAVAIPTNTNSAVAHKVIPHAHAKATKTTAVHKKTPAPVQHTTIVNTTPHAAISNSQEAGASFVVQVGSFNLPANAETLADKLRAKGFATTIQKYHTAQGDMTRVVVGKNGLDHTQVETLRHQLQTEMQINGFVVPQNISGHATTTSSTIHSNVQTSKHINASPSSTSANDEI